MTTEDEERDRFSGRVRRYARVSTAMGGLAARLAGERFLGIRIDRDNHARELTAALGGLKGPLMKVAQLLATIPEALPQEYVQQMIQLQANAPAMGWPFVKGRMAAELGPDWQKRFDSFGRRRRRPPSARFTRPSAAAGRSPASCSIRTCSRRSRQTCASFA